MRVRRVTQMDALGLGSDDNRRTLWILHVIQRGKFGVLHGIMDTQTMKSPDGSIPTKYFILLKAFTFSEHSLTKFCDS